MTTRLDQLAADFGPCFTVTEAPPQWGQTVTLHRVTVRRQDPDHVRTYVTKLPTLDAAADFVSAVVHRTI